MRTPSITVAEVRLRASVHRMGVQHRNGEFRVFFPEYPEDKQERTAYYTDDALDAALTAASMRRGCKETKHKQEVLA